MGKQSIGIFHKVLDVVVNQSKDIIKPNANYNETIPEHILNNPRYYPYFKHVISTYALPLRGLDGRGAHMTREFPMKREGDMKLSFHFQPMTRASREPKGFKENFYYYHSSLCNVIERTFRVWKTRWVLLRDMHVNFDFETQVKMMLASMAIHNYIIMSGSGDATFQTTQEESYISCNDEGHDDGIEPHDEVSSGQRRNDDMYMSAVRDMIAGQIFSRSNTRACNDV
uniref:DDE Tnp4 domain-containing protein n=1 Tax=Lactuca sativa TaxID=4236 RepID=A0A9R1XAC0_LACSA|nr:hypothetical protein LSAT_V11C500294150 [Lactuca sativa]